METALLVFKSKNGDKVVELTDGLTLFAGRTQECDIYLPSPAVSRKHAVFVMRGGVCGVKDLDSSNGTFLNGERLAKPARLREGDTVQIGGYAATFAIARPPAFDDAEQTVIVPREELAKAAAPAAPAAPVAPEKTEEKPEPIPEPVREEVRSIQEAVDSHVRHHTVMMEKVRAEASPKDTSVGDITRDSLRLREQTPSAPRAVAAEIRDEEIGDGAADEAFSHAEEAREEQRDGAEAAEAAVLAGDAMAAQAGVLPGEAPPADLDDSEFADNSARDIGAADGQTVADDDGDAADAAVDAADDNAALDATDSDDDNDGRGESDGSGEGDDAAADDGRGDFSPVLDAIGSVGLPPPREVDPNAITVDQAFRDAVEARLFVYSFLQDMQKERKELVAGLQPVPEAVQSEVDRQEREMLKLPPPEKAEQMIEGRMNRRAALKEKIAEAKKNGTPMPPRPSKAMRQAEDIAINQWTIIAQSAKEALPAAMKEGFRVVAAEPLADILSGIGVDPTVLMGGGAYYLALEQLAEETKYNRAFLKAKLVTVPDPNDKNAGKSGGLMGMFGKKEEAAEEEDGDAAVAAPAPGETFEELTAAEAHMADRASWIAQELGTLEPALVKEFWTVYTKAALRFLPKPEEMTLALRAFLRYGVIGFMPWWMSDEVREHVMADCSKEIVPNMEVSRGVTNILYADEYLGAVLRGECTPALDENLEINAKNSPEWKADKALRRLINTRSQIKLLGELEASLEGRIDKVEQEGAALDDKMKALLPGQKNFKQLKSELGLQRQAFKVEASKLTKLAEKIRDETIAQLRESAEETEARFTSGELPRPTPEFLIERECEGLRKIGRLLANLKERFMPLVMRDFFFPGTDAVNDRTAIQAEIADVEKRDPRIFLETLVDSKKKANRVDLRISPVIVLIPSAGILAFSWNPRQKPEDGRLAIPTCFIRRRLRERQMTYLMADFRWDTSKANAGMDVMASETIVAAFMGVRWDWRKRSKEGREKGLVYSDQNDRNNWRRVYEAYLSTAFDSGKKLFNRNYDFYERVIGKYFDLPEGVELLRK